MRARPADALRSSVALCTYQGARHLAEQLSSLEQQLLPPDEIVVGDDQSTDGTWEALQAFARKTSIPVLLHRNDERMGTIRNFEKTISRCSGDVVFLCDQDDVWHPSKVERVARLLTARLDIAAVFTNARLIDAGGRPLGLAAWDTEQVAFGPAQQRQFRDGEAFMRILQANVVTGATLAFRSEYRDLVLPFPPLLERRPCFHLHDGWIALLLAAVSVVEPIDEPLIDYRIHDGQQMGLALRMSEVEADPRLGPGAAAARRESELDALVSRLRLHADRWPARPDVLPPLEDELAHLRARLGVPTSPLARTRHVVDEWRTGRYGRYSSGLRSAVTDLAPALRRFAFRMTSRS